MKLVFATHNPGKLKEVQEIAGNRFELLSLDNIGFTEDIPEPWPTLEENALEKARTVNRRFGVNCFAEDTGLEIDALNGEPGVLTARYAGEHKSPDDNINLVLAKLQQANSRRARFRTVFALVLNGNEYLFEGIVNGNITLHRQGHGGFGYDPVFMPDGYTLTFAQLPAEVKNQISHRGKAMQQLISFLQQLE
ncbi:non-canonical purine NTP pyrophosphatase, RdgB/HAM1 family [Sphingobacteriales bacterium UPWRP_1]|nr:non-canonical purine NTP pyrophosphatase, RdgB/HAM1 family [Sphingobacteriales bacterium TSM_CSS]PSJ72781.1 non-canonical purine NTP pyrophosphatase, RdgB/HAM1 family [Sphingobacteriales bacterium UPWRP_1]